LQLDWEAATTPRLFPLNRITSGDHEGWYDEWDATDERVFAEAEAQRAAGHRVSARDRYRA
jgi:hypothetical protein